MKTLPVLALVGIAALRLTAIGSDEQSTARVDADPAPSGGFTTLWLLDDRANYMSLNTGEPGGVQQGHEMFNHDGQIDFGAYHAGEFTVGIQGRETGRIVDLGAEADLRQRYGYSDTVPCKQGFASIHVADGHFMIRKGTDSIQGQPFVEANAVFEEEPDGNRAPVALGHIYVVRISSMHGEDPELLVKLHVVGLQPDQSVTLRWETLSR